MLYTPLSYPAAACSDQERSTGVGPGSELVRRGQPQLGNVQIGQGVCRR